MEKYRKTWHPTRTRTQKSGYLKVLMIFLQIVVFNDCSEEPTEFTIQAKYKLFSALTTEI